MKSQLLLLGCLLACTGCFSAQARFATGIWTGRVVRIQLPDEKGNPVDCMAFKRTGGDAVGRFVQETPAVLIDSSKRTVAEPLVSLGDEIRVSGHIGDYEVTAGDGETKLYSRGHARTVLALRINGAITILVATDDHKQKRR
jgi:hypothetical protein